MKGVDICIVKDTMYSITTLENGGYRISFLYEGDFTPLIFTIIDGEISQIESFDGPDNKLELCSVDQSYEAQVLGALGAYLKHQSNSSSE